jgi:hypothetical protein
MSLKTLFLLAGMSSALAIVVLPANAQRPGRGGGMAALEAVDTNADGIITQVELNAVRDAAFARMDGNGDGQITPEEMTASREAQKAERRQGRAEQGFAQLDSNGDGVVVLDEFGGRGSTLFTRLDTNADGQLTKEEREAGRKLMRDRAGQGRGAPAAQ